MAYSQEVVRRARNRLADRQKMHEQQQERHLQEAYRQLPRLREIDRQLRATMVTVARTALDSGAQAAFAQARRENEALRREREQLLATHFPSGLEETPLCPHCGGAGYIGAQMCSCLAELCRQEQQKELTALLGTGPDRFADFRLDVYPEQEDPDVGISPRVVMTAALNACRRYAEKFSLQSGNLLLNGKPGLGKTFLAACIARTAAERGFSVVYETAVHFFEAMDNARFHQDAAAQQAVRRYGACDLLILDDLGTEMHSQVVNSNLYTVLNDRLLAERPMVVTTNLQTAEIARRYSPQIVSRLLGNFRLVAFLGEDVRRLRR